jgi:hypothetical protein
MTRFRKLPGAVTLALIFSGTLFTGQAIAQQVFNTNVVIRNSLCVGFDCPNNPSFGFDTIILRENNLRIFFDDTSVVAGFPANDWRLIANDSASGGANFFAIEDATAARQVFKVSAGARANSIFVSSSSLVGFGTSTPVLSLHAIKGDTPGLRLQQDGSSGFSPQTWDISGNEANFFVRDATNGSKLPFRIRPGAPTSSIDIAANGNVGMGISSPTIANGNGLHINGSGAGQLHLTSGVNSGTLATDGSIITHFMDNNLYITNQENGGTLFYSNGAERMRISSAGNVGIGTLVPATQLHTTGSVRFAGVANCASGIQSDGSGNLSCIVSSRQFKTVTGRLAGGVALANVMALRPQIGAYKATPDVPEHWLIAEDVASVDSALVGFKDGKPYTVKTQNVVADLVAVIQQQQARIEALEKAVAR